LARFPGADWIGPTPNETDGGQVDVHGLVLHIQEGTEAGSEAWFRNPDAQASSHFLNPKSGNLRQLVDTANRAWAEMAGNRHWLSVENEGYSGEELTDSQIENVAQLYAWIHKVYGTPVSATDDPNGSGIGWHGMGGDAWGGHFNCPGEPIKAQRPRIIARVNEILGGGTTPVPAPTPQPQPSSLPHQQVSVDGLNYGYGVSGDQVRTVQQLLADKGFFSHSVTGYWGDITAAAYQKWQESLGYSGSDADGVPGPTSMRKLLWSGQVPSFDHDLQWTGSYGDSPDDSASTWQQKMTDRGWAINGVDGWYGPHCQEICREFQQRHGLTVDGTVGPVTWLMTWMAP
jgi:peptidoglycan hydrolase-like protein with peptidoglycan-binding domain